MTPDVRELGQPRRGISGRPSDGQRLALYAFAMLSSAGAGPVRFAWRIRPSPLNADEEANRTVPVK